MNKKQEERVLGPYDQPKGWRVIMDDPDGHRSSRLFQSEAKAQRYADLLRAELQRVLVEFLAAPTGDLRGEAGGLRDG